MTTQPDHSDWLELVAGYALHSLDPGDETRLREHLTDCEQCREELSEHSLTAAHLASLADASDVVPPAWSRIRSGIVGDVAGEVVQIDDRRRRPAWLLAAAAAVVLLAGGTVAGLQVVRSSGGAGSVPAAIEQCHGVDGCQEIDLRSSDGVRRAAVIVSDGSVRVQPIAMRMAADGRTFVLWQLPRGGAPIPLGEFDSTTATSTSNRLAVSMDQTTAFAVSSEPTDVPPTRPTQVLALGGATS